MIQYLCQGDKIENKSVAQGGTFQNELLKEERK